MAELQSPSNNEASSLRGASTVAGLPRVPAARRGRTSTAARPLADSPLRRAPGQRQMMVRRLFATVTAFAILTAGLGTASVASAEPLDLDGACPTAVVVEDGFTDVAPGSAHERAVDCVTWWRIAQGSDWGGFLPGEPTSRGAMATFVARALATVGVHLPDSPPNAFGDDEANPHKRSIDQLASMGVVGGTAPGRYSPSAVVSRAQMASFIARAVEVAVGTPLPVGPDAFGDDNGSPHEAAIDAVAAAGIAAGTTSGGFAPDEPVNRGQMASFLARTLGIMVKLDLAVPPTDPPPPRNSRYAYVERGSTVGCGTVITRRLDGSGRIAIPDAPSSAGDCGVYGFSRPRLSPDGRMVAYERIAPVEDEHIDTELWVAPTDGASVPRLLRPMARDYPQAVGWLPDGSGVVFDLFEPWPGGEHTQSELVGQFVAPLDGSPAHLYRAGSLIERRSPFGDRVAVVTGDTIYGCFAPNRLAVEPLPSGPHHVVVEEPGICGGGTGVLGATPVWSHDATELLLGGRVGTDDPSAYVVDVSSGAVRQMRASTGQWEARGVVAVSPDGTFIVWACAPQAPTTSGACLSAADGQGIQPFPGLPGALLAGNFDFPGG